jgi:hypothetical protein
MRETSQKEAISGLKLFARDSARNVVVVVEFRELKLLTVGGQ